MECPVYSVADLRIVSEIELHPLHRSSSDIDPEKADVRICHSNYPLTKDDTSCSPGVRYDIDVPETDQGCIRVQDGERIIIDSCLEITPRVRRTIAGAAIGALLYQRGYLVLHGSVVSINAKSAIAFLGPTGAGKSTMAAAFESADYPVLSDDVAPIRIRDGTPIVYPGVPSLKLHDETASSLGITNSDDLDTVLGGKRYFPQQTPTALDPRVLAGVYSLSEGTSTEIEKLTGTEAVMELIQHTYSLRIHEERSTHERHLEQCACVANQIPVKRLIRPRNLAQLPDIREQVLADISE